MPNPLTTVLTRLRPRPEQPARGGLDNYAAEFAASAQAFAGFMRRMPRPGPVTAGPPVGVAVIPWVSTPVPWYSIALALALRARGRAVALIWDDLPYTMQPETWAAQQTHIGRLVRQSGLPVISLRAAAPAAPQPADHTAMTQSAKLNRTWLTRAADVEDQPIDLSAGLFEPMAATLNHIRGMLTAQPFAYLVVPGGIYGSSALLRHAAAQHGVRVATYDANLGVMQVSVDGLAAQQTDLPRAYAALQQLPAADQLALVSLAKQSLARRRAGSDRAQYQVAAGSSLPLTADVVLPLNVEHDAGALGLHHIFENTGAWVRAAVGTVLADSQATIIVRQHPAERRANERSRFPVRALLEETFGQHPRLRFVSAEENINTYDLIQAARLILPFVSTIGIEAAALARPVLMGGASCYANLGFTWTAATADEYQQLLRRGLAGDLGLKPNQTHNAWLAYYLTPICNRVWTEFTPQPPDFWKWCPQPPAALFAQPAVADLLTALDQNQPLSLVRHARRLAAPDTFVSGM